MRRYKTLATILGLMLVAAAPADATIVNVAFSGTFDSSVTSAAYRGTAFTGSFSYDTAIVPNSTGTLGGGTTAHYFPFLTSPLTFNGAFGSASAGNSSSAVLLTNTNNQSSLQVLSYTSAGGQFSFRFFTNDTSFGNEGLPSSFTAPNLTSSVYADLGGSAVYGQISAVSPAAAVGSVPEPASWAMMIVGVGAVGGTLRTRRRRTSTRVSFA